MLTALILLWHTLIICAIFPFIKNLKESLPEFQETKNFTPQGKDEDCQTSNKGEEDKTTKDKKVNNSSETPEKEIATQGNGSELSNENLNIDSNSSLLPINEEQTQGEYKIFSFCINKKCLIKTKIYLDNIP